MRVALVHDYLTQMGGAERVLAALHALYPGAPVFTSVVDPAVLPPEWRDWDIRPALLNRLPGAARDHRRWAPLYPAIFRAFGPALRAFDVVIADTSAWAHHAPAAHGAVQIAYCHSPARFLYRDPHYLEPARLPRPAMPLAATAFAGLRALDRRAARRVDRYLANSRAVADRVQAAYGIAAPVVYPPVATDRFAAAATGIAPGAAYVAVSRLVPHKRVDLVVAAFTRLGRPLDIIGAGRDGVRLRALAGPTVRFLGPLGDVETAIAVAHSRGLVLPAVEDFGITAVEAQAAGRPVIALAAGGALETVLPGRTGILFAEPAVEALIAAVAAAERVAWDPRAMQANAARFGVERFQREIAAVVAAAVAGMGEHRGGTRHVDPASG